MLADKEKRLKHDTYQTNQEYGLAAIHEDVNQKANQTANVRSVERIEENLLSVVIPVFNAEKSLQSCVESVLSQTYHNLELLLVDDGSTDASPKLCDRFSEMDSRVRVFHIANSGPSEARNVGLLHVRGQYLAFVDADDHIESDMYETMIRRIKEERVQMAICNWKKHMPHSNLCKDSDIGNCGRMKAGELRKIIAIKDTIGGGGFPWNRVIDWKSVMERANRQILFPHEVKVYEDKIWVIRILGYMQDVILIPDVKYHYIIDEGSLSHRKVSDRICDFIRAWELIDQEFEYQLPMDAVTARGQGTLSMLWEVTKEKRIDLLRKIWPECADIAKIGARNTKRRIQYWVMRGLSVGARK